jgi:sugar phosphate isomerase/epimerase
MNPTRRQFLAAGLAVAPIAALAQGTAPAATPAAKATAIPTSGGFAMTGRIKLGLVTYNLAKDWDITTILTNCSKTGFQGVELRTTHKHGVEVSLNATERADVKRRFADSPVELYSLGSAFDYHTPDPTRLRADIEATKRYLQLAHDVGASGIKVRPNGLPKEVPEEKTLEQIGRSLRELGETAANLGLQVRLEVHGTATSSLPRIRRIMDVASHRSVGVCWNSNQSDLDGAGFDANFDLVRDRIIEVHLRDLFLAEYPFRRLFTRLTEIGYSGYTLAEIPESTDPIRVMHYFRGMWLAHQGLI